jgi:SAM-dependent methyltransferase
MGERPSGLTSRDAAMLLISASTVLLELLFTRVFSVVMYHHFSFLAVALAMTGIGAAGLLVNAWPMRFRADNVRSMAPLLASGFAVGVVGAALVAFNSSIRLATDAENWRRVAVVLLAAVVPFTAGGLLAVHILAFDAERANRLYFFNLLGAGLACLLFVPATAALGAPSALLATAGLGAASGAVLGDTARSRRACGMLAGALLVVAALNVTRGWFDVSFVRGGPVPPALVTRWNSFSRVEVRGTPEDMRRMRAAESWGFSTRVRPQARELYLLYDAGALTQIVGFDGDVRNVAYLVWDVTSAPHHVRRSASVLVLGSGGGRDVLAALAAGSERVVAVEINDITVDLMRGVFRDFTGGLYAGRPGVEVVVEDGRSFVRRTSQRFDLIQASLLDTFAASAAGAYALTENSLYTVEAFDDYFGRLNPDGILSFSRWYDTPPAEVFRVLSLARESLGRLGVSVPGRHVAIVRTNPALTHRPSLATILVKRSAFTDDEIAALDRWSRAMDFDLAYAPGAAGARGSEPAFQSFLGTEEQAARFKATAPFDLSPTTDDRPFFFDRIPLATWLMRRAGLASPSLAAGELPFASRTLLAAFIATGTIATVVFFLPLARGWRKGEAPAPRRMSWAAYFGCLGIGYMVVELFLVQRLNLYLGHPSHALTVVLFTMLVGSGFGSLVAQRWPPRAALAAMVALVGAGIAALAVGLGPVLGQTLTAPLPVRMAIAASCVAPVAFVMGMPFPTGLRRAARTSSALVSWAWAVNGATSIFGSVLAVVVSMSAGFSWSLLVAGAAYLAALGLVWGPLDDLTPLNPTP